MGPPSSDSTFIGLFRTGSSSFSIISAKEVSYATPSSHEYHATFEKYKRMILKKTWRTISDVLFKSSKKNSHIKEISLDDNLIKDYKIIADNFNELFVNIGPNYDNNIDTANKKKHLLRI